MKLLFTSPVLEHPPAGGPALRIENSIKALGRICEQHIISRSAPAIVGGDSVTDFYLQHSKKFSYAPACRNLSANRYFRKLKTVLQGLTSSAINQDADYILRYVDQHGIDIIWFGYGNISFPLIQALKARRPQLKLICDSDSVWSRFIYRELPLVRSPFRRWLINRRGAAKEAEEQAWVNLCDISTAVSEVDAAYYRGLAKDPERVQIFANVIDLETYEKPPPAPEDYQKPSVFLGGTFGHFHSPMDVAARWFLDDILPLVKQSIPDVHVYIVGKGSDRTMGHRSSSSVTVTGKVHSVLPYLCHADVSIVPLKFESGTRFKILEGAACGIPLVSTVLGAEGLPVENEKHILIADDPKGFAEAIVRLIKNPDLGQRLAGECKQIVQQDYSVDTLEHQARGILEKLNHG